MAAFFVIAIGLAATTGVRVAPAARMGGSRRELLLRLTVAPAAASALLFPQRACAQTKLGPLYIKMASPKEITAVFRVIAEEPGGESLKLLRLMIETEDWDRVKQMSLLYDTFLRKDVLQPLAGRLGSDAPKATAISDEVLATFKGINRAARKKDKARALELTGDLVSQIDAYLQLEPGVNFRAAEATKLGMPAG